MSTPIIISIEYVEQDGGYTTERIDLHSSGCLVSGSRNKPETFYGCYHEAT